MCSFCDLGTHTYAHAHLCSFIDSDLQRIGDLCSPLQARKPWLPALGGSRRERRGRRSGALGALLGLSPPFRWCRGGRVGGRGGEGEGGGGGRGRKRMRRRRRRCMCLTPCRAPPAAPRARVACWRRGRGGGGDWPQCIMGQAQIAEQAGAGGGERRRRKEVEEEKENHWDCSSLLR